jgi:hypothetical protein
MLRASETQRKWFTYVSQKLGRNLSDDEDEGSLEDLINCQVSSEKLPYFPGGQG